MTEPHRLSRRDARRIAVRAQLLTADRPSDLLALVRHLGVLQADPATAVAPSAELVVWSRLGSSYRLGGVAAAQGAGDLVELDMMLRPPEDLALFRAEMAAWPEDPVGEAPLKDWQEEQRDWLTANDDCRREILAKLHDEGPLPSRDLPDTTLVPWQSSGWNDARNVRMLLGLLVRRGEVAAAGVDGRDRLWDLAERVYPDDPVVPAEEALRVRGVRRLRALGIARARSAEMPAGEQNYVGPAGEPAVVEGVRGEWRVDPAYLDPAAIGAGFRGRAALLSPLDRLVIDRRRMAELFEFDYQLEMFKPAAERRWGYWALPILHHDRLVGKLDATADRDAGVLRVHAVHEDGDWTKPMRAAVDREVRDLARWLDLAPVRAGEPE
jgi:uncharacterized protein YcaQ